MEHDDRVGGGGGCEGPGWRVRGSSPILGFVSGPVGSAVSAMSPPPMRFLRMQFDFRI